MNIAEVMAFLLDRSVVGLPAASLADVFDRLIWCMDDNGREIESFKFEWLFSDDRRKVEVALYMSETFHFDNVAAFENCFERIINVWPDLEPKCIEVLNSWKFERD
ncbi:MAG: hypothetical protein AAGC78_14595 [Cellvibrio sp.]|uniref:hypothetical protein n=1 Tax=Cellvibrio sp. TaxID=1965322 RepID=UPI0031B10518